MRPVFVVVLLGTLLAIPAVGQECNEEATIGNFDVEFQGAFFDGTDTEFSYCVTGLPGQALSHWVLELLSLCVDPGDVVDCGPEPCYYQINDPTTGVTGLKWDDLAVEPGETECFDFSLAGDWTSSIGNVTAATKAGQGVAYGEICGPVCETCISEIIVRKVEGRWYYAVYVKHNKPPTYVRKIEYALLKGGQVVKAWDEGPITFQYQSVYKNLRPLPLEGLAPGQYVLVMRLDGMAGWRWKTKPFVVQ